MENSKKTSIREDLANIVALINLLIEIHYLTEPMSELAQTGLRIYINDILDRIKDVERQLEQL